jgi:hypothetical protein
MYAGSPKSSDLVVHQRQQRRDHNGDTNVHDCRKLEAKTLAEARCSLEIDIVALEHGNDDFSLDGPPLCIRTLSSERGWMPYLKVSFPKTRRSVKSISTFSPNFRFGNPGIVYPNRS